MSGFTRSCVRLTCLCVFVFVCSYVRPFVASLIVPMPLCHDVRVWHAALNFLSPSHLILSLSFAVALLPAMCACVVVACCVVRSVSLLQSQLFPPSPPSVSCHEVTAIMCC